jgi:hypothetical protein
LIQESYRRGAEITQRNVEEYKFCLCVPLRFQLSQASAVKNSFMKTISNGDLPITSYLNTMPTLNITSFRVRPLPLIAAELSSLSNTGL